MKRTYFTEKKKYTIRGFGAKKEILKLNSRWVNIEDILGVVGIYGFDSFYLYRPGERPASYPGVEGGLYYDEICCFCKEGLCTVDGPAVVLDNGCMTFSSVDHRWTSRYCISDKAHFLSCASPEIRAVWAEDFNGKNYILVVNFGRQDTHAEIKLKENIGAIAMDLTSGKKTKIDSKSIKIYVSADEAILLKVTT